MSNALSRSGHKMGTNSGPDQLATARRGLFAFAMENVVKQGATPQPARYGTGAVTFHWTVAALIVFLGALGLLFDDIPREARPFWINVHVCVGLIYSVLVIARLLWRAKHKAPDIPPDIGEFNRRTSLFVHHLLYVLMFAIPIVGIVARVWHGRPFNYGVFQLNFGIASESRRLSSGRENPPTVGLRPVRPRRLHAAGAPLPSLRPTRRDPAADDAQLDRLSVAAKRSRREAIVVSAWPKSAGPVSLTERAGFRPAASAWRYQRRKHLEGSA